MGCQENKGVVQDISSKIKVTINKENNKQTRRNYDVRMVGITSNKIDKFKVVVKALITFI